MSKSSTEVTVALALAAVAASCGGPDRAAAPVPQAAAVAPSIPVDEPGQGWRVVYSIDLPPGETGTEVMARAVEVLQTRLRSVVEGAAVTSRGGQLVIELPPLEDEALDRVLDLASRAGRLELRLVDAGSQRMRRVAEAVLANPPEDDIVRVEEDYWVHPTSGASHRSLYLTAPDREVFMSVEEARDLGCYHEHKPVVSGEVSCVVSGRTTLEAHVAALGAADPDLRLPGDHELVFGRSDVRGVSGWRTYYVHRDDPLDGLVPAEVESVAGAEPGQNDLIVTLGAADAERLEQVSSENVGNKLVFLLDGVVLMAPVILETVAGGQLRIALPPASFEATEQGVAALVVVLRSGPLPGSLVQESLEPIPRDR